MIGTPPLVARAERLGSAFDLLAGFRHGSGVFLERSGLGVAGAGVAMQLGGGPSDPDGLTALAAQVSAALRGIEPAREGPAAVAFGSIPFAQEGAASFVVPARTIRRTDEGETWAIDVTPEGEPAPVKDAARRVGGGEPHKPFDRVQITPMPTPEGYMAGVGVAIAKIRAGELRKLVVARTLVVEAGRRLDARKLLWRLRAVDPDCYAFAVHPDPGRTLVGASPEMLVSRRGARVRADPLAGSAPRSGDAEKDRASGERLLGSAKDLEEHAVVREAVADALAPVCEELTFAEEPELLGTANVWHLSTPFRGRLREPFPTALELVARMHPTPAVCGAPRDAARRALETLEPFGRGGYAGPVGWVDAAGDGEWAIALRCAELEGGRARLFAGAGIVAASEPARELDETDRKFRALLDALRWG